MLSKTLPISWKNKTMLHQRGKLGCIVQARQPLQMSGTAWLIVITTRRRMHVATYSWCVQRQLRKHSCKLKVNWVVVKIQRDTDTGSAGHISNAYHSCCFMSFKLSASMNDLHPMLNSSGRLVWHDMNSTSRATGQTHTASYSLALCFNGKIYPQ